MIVSLRTPRVPRNEFHFNDRQRVWTTSKGQVIKIMNMNRNHLVNAIKKYDGNWESKQSLVDTMKDELLYRNQLEYKSIKD